MVEQIPESVTALLTDFGTRLNEIEEKQRLIKDRMVLIGKNLISLKEDYNKEIFEIKKEINQINIEIKSLKQLTKRIIEELENFSRKTELEILERQFKIFQPLEFARIEDVERITKRILEENLKTNFEKTTKYKK